MMLIPRNNFDLFDDIFVDPFFRKNESKIMKTDIKETDNKFIIDIDLPGYNKENINVDVTDGYLTISACIKKENEEDNNSKYIRRERYFGECSRSFYVGDQIQDDDVSATFRNGILSLEVPKVEEKEKTHEKKYIDIKD